MIDILILASLIGAGVALVLTTVWKIRQESKGYKRISKLLGEELEEEINCART